MTSTPFLLLLLVYPCLQHAGLSALKTPNQFKGGDACPCLLACQTSWYLSPHFFTRSHGSWGASIALTATSRLRGGGDDAERIERPTSADVMRLFPHSDVGHGSDEKWADGDCAMSDVNASVQVLGKSIPLTHCKTLSIPSLYLS